MHMFMYVCVYVHICMYFVRMYVLSCPVLLGTQIEGDTREEEP